MSICQTGLVNEKTRHIQLQRLSMACFSVYLRFRFPFPCGWYGLALPRWLVGLFMCLDNFNTSMRLMNCSLYYSPIKMRYFNGSRRALRVGAFPKNPTRRWRYQNKTIVLFFMDSSMAQWADRPLILTGILIHRPGLL